MCGIAGIFAYGASAPPVEERELVACRDHMAARGPDARGLWIDEAQRIGLVHRRLAIIDLDERSSQPMHTADGRLTIVFNGEIYNYRELRSALMQSGVEFRTSSDTEVLLHLFRDRGEDMVDALRGMYAFAIWDHQARDLFLARDPYGIKPLYWADDGGTFRFASQVRALLSGGHVPGQESAAGWTGFHLFGSVPEPWTTFEAIRSLEAGSTMRVSANGRGSAISRYSVGQAFCNGAAEAMRFDRSESEVADEARAALLDSVRHHLVADVPVGAFLSGGIDSGALVGLMRDAGQADIQTMTLSFEEFAGDVNDEAPIAAEVARAYGTRHTRRVVTEQEFQRDLPLIFAAMDQPTIDGINTWFIAKAAKELGLKVVVSGLGGDELLGGYPSFTQMPRMVRLMRPFSLVPALGRGLRSALNFAGPARFGLSAKAAGLAELGGTYPGAYLLRRGLFMPWELDAVMPAELARRGLEEIDVLVHVAAQGGNRPASDFAQVAASGVYALHAQSVAARHRLDEHGPLARSPRAAGRPASPGAYGTFAARLKRFCRQEASQTGSHSSIAARRLGQAEDRLHDSHQQMDPRSATEGIVRNRQGVGPVARCAALVASLGDRGERAVYGGARRGRWPFRKRTATRSCGVSQPNFSGDDFQNKAKGFSSPTQRPKNNETAGE